MLHSKTVDASVHPARMLNAGADEMDVTAAIAHFREHGYARLGKVASDDTIEALRTRAEDIMLGRVVYPNLFFQIDGTTGRYDKLTYGRGYEGPSLNYRKIEKLEQDPLYLAWIENPLFERIARTIILGDIVIYRALLFSKARKAENGDPGGTVLPWHQDGGKFWGLDRDPLLQVWTALDDTPVASGCVEVFPGSHLFGLATPLGGVVQERLVDHKEANAQATPLPVRAGDVLLIHNHVWHRSGVNTTDTARRAFTVCYMTAQTRCLRTKKAPRTFFPVFRG